LCNLSDAVKALDPEIADALAAGDPSSAVNEALGEIGEGVNKLEQDVHRIATKLGVHLIDSDEQPAKSSKKNTSTPDTEANARVTIRQIRRALNEFRDNQRLGIVHTRNQLMANIFVMGFITFALLCIAILPAIPTNSGPQPERATILATVVFYIVGAIFGLFGTIYRQSRAST